MSIFIFRSVFVYTRCAKRTLIRMKQVCCVTEFRFGKGLFCTAEAKVLFKVCLWSKILLSIANSTSRCSAQNLAHLGSKAINRRHDSFPSGHDQRTRCQIFSNVHNFCLLQRYWLFTKKLCYLLFSISVALGQFSSNWPDWSSCNGNTRPTKCKAVFNYWVMLNPFERVL